MTLRGRQTLLLSDDLCDDNVFEAQPGSATPCRLPPLRHILSSGLFFFLISSVSERKISFLAPVPETEMG